MAIKLREIVNFPIHQATHTNDIFKLLGGHKDDVFVYDRYSHFQHPLYILLATYRMPKLQSSYMYIYITKKKKKKAQAPSSTYSP